MKHIVCMGGGTGMAAVLMSLKPHPVHLTAIVSMVDDGQSQAVLRDQYGVLPPSDLRKTLLALADGDSVISKAFKYRFRGGPFHDFSMGNIFLAAFEKSTGDLMAGIACAAKMLNVKGTVLPVTLDNARLFAELHDGTIIKGETNIDIHNGTERAPIKRVWLEPEARMFPAVEQTLSDADTIIIGPGDLYTSLVPTLLVKGVTDAMKKSRAKKVFITSLMTKHGETDNYTAKDYVEEIEKYLGFELDQVICNNKKPSKEMTEQYAHEKAYFINPLPVSEKVIVSGLLVEDDYIRHDNGKKLAEIVLPIIK